MLRVESLSAWYGRQQVLHELSLTVDRGECVAIVGSNGAGKTTLARTLAGVGARARGQAILDGVDLLRTKPHRIAEQGLGLVPERGGIFGRMTVYENLQLSMEFSGRRDPDSEATLSWCFEMFPRLAERRSQRAATLSGGERRMLLVSRALLGGATHLLLDEPSLGLSPQLTSEVIAGMIPKLVDRGIAVLLVEQNARQALSVSARAYVLESGQFVLHGSGTELLASDLVRSAYLGL